MRQLQKGEVGLGMVVKFETFVKGDCINVQGPVVKVYKHNILDDYGFDIDMGQSLFTFRDGDWGDKLAYLIEDIKTIEEVTVTQEGPIKSDGGSSSYYDIEVPSWLLEILNQRSADGKCFIKTEEVNEILGNDFNYATMFKSMVRAISIENGVGKEGNTHQYECNKVRYYIDRVEEKFSRGK